MQSTTTSTTKTTISNRKVIRTFSKFATRLSTDVIEIRQICSKPFGSLTQLFVDLNAQVAHLDQLHTQTRSLLVRQAQIISELRQQVGLRSWTEWALKISRMLDEQDQNGFVNKRNCDDVVELRLEIEDQITSLVARVQNII